MDFGLYERNKLELVNSFLLNCMKMTDSELNGAGIRRGDCLLSSGDVNAINNKRGNSSKQYDFDHLPLVFDFKFK